MNNDIDEFWKYLLYIQEQSRTHIYNYGNFVCRLAIIQLSTRNEVFILDVIALTDNVKDSDLQQFAENVFANPQVLKLGNYYIIITT